MRSIVPPITTAMYSNSLPESGHPNGFGALWEKFFWGQEVTTKLLVNFEFFLLNIYLFKPKIVNNM